MIPTHQRPTPETDAFIGDQDEDCMTEGEIALCKFTRSLEQRLAETQEKLSELDAAQAQIVALRKQSALLRSMLADERHHAQHTVDSLYAISHAKPEQRNELWHQLVHVSHGRMTWPDKIPPPVVPLADLQPFLAAIAAYAEFNGGCGHHPEDCPREAEECKIVAAFNTAQLAFFRKYPAAHFPKS